MCMCELKNHRLDGAYWVKTQHSTVALKAVRVSTENACDRSSLMHLTVHNNQVNKVMHAITIEQSFDTQQKSVEKA